MRPFSHAILSHRPLFSRRALRSLRIRREDMPWLAHYKEGAGWPPGTGVVF